MKMTHEYKKAKLLAAEMMDYFFYHRAKEIDVRITFTEELLTITVHSQLREQPKDWRAMIDQLKKPRQYELEEYYEDLLGLRDDSFNAEIVAAMIDEVEEQVEANDVTIILRRKLSA